MVLVLWSVFFVFFSYLLCVCGFITEISKVVLNYNDYFKLKFHLPSGIPIQDHSSRTTTMLHIIPGPLVMSKWWCKDVKVEIAESCVWTELLNVSEEKLVYSLDYKKKPIVICQRSSVKLTRCVKMIIGHFNAFHFLTAL